MFTKYLLLAIILFTHTLRAHEDHNNDPAQDMVSAANNFISSLSKAQKSEAIFKPNDDHREGWYFIPDKFIKPSGKRKGLLIKNMNQQQRLLAHALLASAMSSDGYRQAATVMTLEAILHELENKNPIRDPELYYVSIFGKPDLKSNWGWRFEGHHLSININVANGQLFSVTPSFFGTNPAQSKEGPFKGLEVLADEQILARKLAQSLDADQSKLAILPGKAPADIITKQERVAERKTFMPPKGIPFNKLNKDQQQELRTIIDSYIQKYRPGILNEINGRKKIIGNNDLYFAWAGSLKPEEGHYYRIQSNDFLFEYDNTQNGANHVHAVWRDFDGDFGRDILKEHHKEKH
jgi:hypothetical protein|tara:strand:- start:1212 stop:2261 length:1050 start_codon:yes stop_codon:yes gene_type:complete